MSRVLAYFVRHGETELNRRDCFRGPLNPELSPQGVTDAAAAAEFLRPLQVLPTALTSSKKRTLHTAAVIQHIKAMSEPRSSAVLDAWDVGHLGGEPKTDENVAEIQSAVENPNTPIRGGESLNQFRARVRPALQFILENGFNAGVPVLAVTHSSVIHEVGEFLNGDHNSTLVKPGGVVKVWLDNGKLRAAPVFRPDSAAARRRRADVVT